MYAATRALGDVYSALQRTGSSQECWDQMVSWRVSPLPSQPASQWEDAPRGSPGPLLALGCTHKAAALDFVSVATAAGSSERPHAHPINSWNTRHHALCRPTLNTQTRTPSATPGHPALHTHAHTLICAPAYTCSALHIPSPPPPPSHTPPGLQRHHGAGEQVQGSLSPRPAPSSPAPRPSTTSWSWRTSTARSRSWSRCRARPAGSACA